MIIKNQQVKFRKETGLRKCAQTWNLPPASREDTNSSGSKLTATNSTWRCSNRSSFTFQEASQNWVEEVYLPVLKTVSQSGLLRDFPARTPTDLYIWLTRYQKEISQQYGWEIKPAVVVDSLAAAYGNRLIHRWKRFKKSIFPRCYLSADWYRGLAKNPPHTKSRGTNLFCHTSWDQWRRRRLAGPGTSYDHRQKGEQLVARVTCPPGRTNTFQKSKSRNWKVNSETALMNSGISATLHLEEGEVTSLLNQRALWNDLLVFSLEHPPRIALPPDCGPN